MIYLNRLDRAHRWFTLIAILAFAIAFVFAISNFPTEDRLWRAFWHQRLASIDPEKSDLAIARQIEEALQEQGMSFEKWKLEQDAHYEKFVADGERELRVRIAEFRASDGELAQYRLDDVKSAEESLNTYRKWRADWRESTARVKADIDAIGATRIRFLVDVFLLYLTFPLVVSYGLLRGIRWAHLGESPIASPFMARAGDVAIETPSDLSLVNLQTESAKALSPSRSAKVFGRSVKLVDVLLVGSGRSGRLAFLGACVLGLVLATFFTVLMAVAIALLPGHAIQVSDLAGALGYVLGSFAVLAPTIRRLHDIDTRGSYALALFLPGLGLLLLLVLSLVPGTKGPNRFGEP